MNRARRRIDVMTPDQRYRAMLHNRGRTGPERALASILWRRGLRFLTAKGYQSLARSRLPGNPDMVFSRHRIVIFVDGCFWHGCPSCNRATIEMSDAWQQKIHVNMERDERVTKQLEETGWTVFRVPEHVLNTKGRLEQTAQGLLKSLRRPGAINRLQISLKSGKSR